MKSNSGSNERISFLFSCYCVETPGLYHFQAGVYRLLYEKDSERGLCSFSLAEVEYHCHGCKIRVNGERKRDKERRKSMENKAVNVWQPERVNLC